MHFCCCWDRASHWIMLALNSWSSLLPLPYNSTLNLVTFPGLITCSLVARDHRFCLPSNSEKILTDCIIQWFLHHEKHHLDWSSQCVLSTLEYYTHFPKEENKALKESFTWQGQNSNSDLKSQAPKSWPPLPPAMLPEGLSKNPDTVSLQPTTGTTAREWNPSSLMSFTATRQQGKSLPELPWSCCLGIRGLNGSRSCLVYLG